MADENTPISIDSAVSMMLSKPESDKALAADKAPAQDSKPAPAADTAPAADDKPVDTGDDTPAQDDAPAATDDDGEQGSLPPIEAPSSWNAEDKEFFKSLPRKAQETLARREQDRDTALRNGQNTIAEQRKAAEGEASRLKGLADRIQAQITEQVNDLARDFPEVKDQASLEALAASDPGRFSQFQARLMRFNAAQAAQAEAQQELQKKVEAATRDAMAASHKELVKHFPTWNDPKVATKEITELQDYAIREFGVSEQAARAMHDPVIYRMATKSMLYDKAQAEKAKALNREAPRTVKPGASTAPSKGERVQADRAKQIGKLDKSGDIMDALPLMLVNSR